MNVFLALSGFIVLAIIVEAIVEVVKPLFPEKIIGIQMPVLLGIVFGIVVTLIAGYNVFEPLGFSISSKVLGEVLTGILAGGGSKLAHELVSKLRASRDDLEVSKPPADT